MLRGDQLVEEDRPPAGTPEAELAGARELFRRGAYGPAADIFESLGGSKKSSPAVVMEATFYEAESLRLQGRYPRAADLYSKLLKKFPASPYREQALQHLYAISDYWLDETREAMRQSVEVAKGKRLFVEPYFLNFDQTKPFADAEGLKDLMVADLDKFASAFTAKLATYALRRGMTFDDRKSLAKITEQNKADHYTLSTLIGTWPAITSFKAGAPPR